METSEKDQIIQSLSQQLNEMASETLERMKVISRLSRQLVTKESEVMMLMGRVQQAEHQVHMLNDKVTMLEAMLTPIGGQTSPSMPLVQVPVPGPPEGVQDVGESTKEPFQV